MTQSQEPVVMDSPGFETNNAGQPVGQPGNLRELAELFGRLVDSLEDDTIVLDGSTGEYRKKIEVIWRFAYAAAELAQKEIGATKGQYNAASILLLGKMRNFGPYVVLTADSALLPGFDPVDDAVSFYARPEIKEWIAEEATRRLATGKNQNPTTVKHWEGLASYKGVVE